MSYARVIVNPIAGAGKTARKWRQIMGFLKDSGLHFDYDVTEAPGHAIELAKTAAMKGYEVVVAVGGDGTLNEVVNGIYDANSLARVMVGVINTGAGGDYIRSVGIPRDLGEACQWLKQSEKAPA